MFTFAALEPGWRVFGLLTVADLALVAVLLASVVVGFCTGFIWQLVCIISFGISIWATVLYTPVVADFVGTRFSEPVRLVGSAVVVFIAALVVCYMFAYLFRGLIDALKPRMTDRVLGGLLGFINGALLVSLFAFVALEFMAEHWTVRAYVCESKGLSAMGTCLAHALPDGLREPVKGTDGLSRFPPHPAATGTARPVSAPQEVPLPLGAGQQSPGQQRPGQQPPGQA